MSLLRQLLQIRELRERRAQSALRSEREALAQAVDTLLTQALARGPGARWPRVFRPAAAAVLVLWAAAIAVHWSPRLAVFEMRRYEQAYADGAGAALARFRPGALVVCSAFSGALYYYTPFAVLRSDQLQPADFTRHAERLQTADREIGAVLFESEATEAFRRCPGNWTRVARVGNVGLWRLAPP